LPGGAVARLGTTRLRHGDAIPFAAYLPDGKSLVTAGRDGTVRLWDLSTGKEIRRFAWPEGKPDAWGEPSGDEITQRWERQLWDDLALGCQAALSSDGKTVAASQRGVVCLWETSSGKKLLQLQTGQKRLDQMAFSPGGKRLLTVGPGQTAAVWEVATGKCFWRCKGKPVDRFRVSQYAATMEQIAVVSPGWKYLAFREQAKNDGPWSIKIKELATGKEVAQIQTIDGRAPLIFSPDERTLVWDRFQGGIVFSDVRTGKELRRLGNGGARYDMATSFAFSAHGASLAIIRLSHTIELWDLTSGRQTGRFASPSPRPGDQVGPLVRPALVFSPDGKELACSLGGAVLRRFEAGTAREITAPNSGQRAPVSALAPSADGRSLWTWGPGDPVRCWDWATGRETTRRGTPSRATHAAFTSAGRMAFADDKNITLFGADGKPTRRVPAAEAPLLALALSPDGAVLATRSFFDREIHLWDEQGKQRRALGAACETPRISSSIATETAGVATPDVMFSPDGRCLAGAGPRQQLCLWDVTTGKLLWELPPRVGEVIERFTFSPNGLSLATVNADTTVTLYDARTGARRGRLGEPDRKKSRLHLTFSFPGGSGSLGTRGDVPVCLAVSPDGRYLATAQETPIIHLWDVLAGRKVGRLEGHEGGVVSLMFAADGRHLFSGGADTTALTWDVSRFTKRPAGRAVRLHGRELEALWGDLAGGDAERAFTAMRKLCSSPGQAVRLIERRVRPAAAPEPSRLARLIADLESGSFERRRQARAELQGLGELAEPALRRALLEGPPLGVRQRLERLLKLHGQAPPPAKRRELRAVEVLEMIGGAEARRVLRNLAEGAPSSRLTRTAHGAKQRLDKQVVGR
jgi:WD40 repeat protein